MYSTVEDVDTIPQWLESSVRKAQALWEISLYSPKNIPLICNEFDTPSNTRYMQLGAERFYIPRVQGNNKQI